MIERNVNTYVNLIQVLMGVIVFSLFCLAFFFLGGAAFGSLLGMIVFTAKAAGVPIAIYVLNYCLLVPGLFFRGRKTWFFLIDTVLVLALTILPVIFMEIPQGEELEELRQQLKDLTFTNVMIGSVLLKIMLCICMITLAVGMRYVTRWAEYRRILEEERRRNTEAELTWLKNQLNPHFLFNTLNNISSLVKMDADKAQESICQLSELLRYALYDSNCKKVKVRDEVEFMRNYVDLMSLRCNSKTRVEVCFDDFDESVMISPLMFISLVENAFKHGISAHLDSFIRIDMGMEGDDIVFSCENTLIERSTKDYSGSGVGLENMRRRLDLIYPDSHSYEQFSENGVYVTVVRIKNVKSDA